MTPEIIRYRAFIVGEDRHGVRRCIERFRTPEEAQRRLPAVQRRRGPTVRILLSTDSQIQRPEGVVWWPKPGDRV